ncbi:hypothetical protein LTR62_001288 [Meristemomyces frigidus]|uniref:Cytochrome P450 n=1 Tax=Meristemomyces frigidus TaxID=1508187 RepID=A0AAN7YBU6_9PEZI|nr:hypothetical protein LTR62_001288 [Meristemomyces frigidus]
MSPITHPDIVPAKAKELKCQDAPLLPGGGVMGLKNLKAMNAADKIQRFTDLLIEREGVMSKHVGRKCSTYKTGLLGQTLYVTSDPKNIQALLATQFQDFDLGPARRGNIIALLGDGIFVQDGEAWSHSRALLRPQFARDQVSDLELEERHLQDLMTVLPAKADGWTAETDIQTLFFRLTMDTATEFLFGESVDSQISESKAVEGGKKDELAFTRNWDSAQKYLAARFRLGDMYWLNNPKEFKHNNKVVNDFLKHYVDLALSKGSAEKDSEDGHKKYVLLNELAKHTRDPAELSGQLLNILLAGRDTTASLLSWLFKELLRHPAVYQKLRKTILEDFGSYEEPKNITFATLKGCQYLQHTLNETLRLWAVVPSNARRSNKGTTIPRGGGPDGQSPVFIPPNTDVMYTIHVTHRRKDLWGEDADEFKPERWVGRKPGWEYLPFNGGPRICIGQQFALTEASYVVVRLLQRFDAIEPGVNELQAGGHTSDLGLTNAPAQKVRLRLHEARR